MKTLLEMTVPSGLRYDYQYQYAQQALDLGYTEEDWIHQNEVHLKMHQDTMRHSGRYHAAVKDSLNLICAPLGVSYEIQYEGGISHEYHFLFKSGHLIASMTVSSVFLLNDKDKSESLSRLFMFKPGERIEVTKYRHCIHVHKMLIDYDYKTLDLDDDYASDSIEFPLRAMSVFAEILKCFKVK